MRVLALQVVNVQRDKGVVHEALKKFMCQLRVKSADHAAFERHVHHQARPTREINHHAAQGFVQRHVGVAVAANPFFIAHRLVYCLAQRDAHIFNRVMAIDVQVALSQDVQVNQPVAGDLVQHVVKKTDAGA